MAAATRILAGRVAGRTCVPTRRPLLVVLPLVRPHGVRRKEFVQWFPDEQAESSGRGTQLTAILRETGLLIGKCGIRRKSASDWEADIGYEIAPGYWQRSYATEEAASLVKHGFTSMGLHQISSWCIAENGASIGVLRNLGMRKKADCGRTSSSKGVGGTPWSSAY